MAVLRSVAFVFSAKDTIKLPLGLFPLGLGIRLGMSLTDSLLYMSSEATDIEFGPLFRFGDILMLLASALPCLP